MTEKKVALLEDLESLAITKWEATLGDNEITITKKQGKAILKDVISSI